MTINSHDKGSRGELEVVAILKGHDFDAEKQGCYKPHDILLWPDGRDYEPKIVEVKRNEKLTIKQIWEELKTRDYVFHRRNHQDWMVTVKGKDFMELLLLAYPRGK